MDIKLSQSPTKTPGTKASCQKDRVLTICIYFNETAINMYTVQAIFYSEAQAVQYNSNTHRCLNISEKCKCNRRRKRQNTQG